MVQVSHFETLSPRHLARLHMTAATHILAFPPVKLFVSSHMKKVDPRCLQKDFFSYLIQTGEGASGHNGPIQRQRE